jgi:hypothetical protein
MKLISHRGNIDGPNPVRENSPYYIMEALAAGYDVEVDVWYKDDSLWLGHDDPTYPIDISWLLDRQSMLWIHCKNVEAVVFLQECEYEFNYFWHQEDTLTLTSQKSIWVYPGKQPIKNSIAVMPELNQESVVGCVGVCSDFISSYKNK